MMGRRWVQHISGQGEKWEVFSERIYEWSVLPRYQITDLYTNGNHFLPKSEYRLCNPPEEWEDVTGECGAFPWTWDPSHPSHEHDGTFYISHNWSLVKKGEYRITKIDGMHNGPAFIIERRKS